MAKTESTAVNELIDLVQNGKQDAAPEPAADLFSAPRSTRVSPPRMTSPIPPMRGAGEVEPLPRQRAPHSTSQHLPTPVRMSTADPTRGNTIPPLSRSTTRPSTPPSRATSSNPAVRATASNPTLRASAPALPPPRTTPRSTSQQPVQRASAPAPQRASSPRATASVPVQQRPTVPSVPSLPPRSAPVAAPFEARSDNPFSALPAVPQQYPILARPQTVDVTGDLVKADNWFDVSAAVHKIDADGTAVVVRPNPGTLALVKKLIVPTILLAIVGVMIGGYFAFDGDGGKRKKPSAAPAAAVAQAPAAEQRVAMSAAPTAPAPTTPPVTAATDTPAAAAEAEPPTKAEQVAKQEAAAAAETASMLPAATTAAINKQPAPAAAPAPAPPAPPAAAPPAAAPPAAAPPAVAVPAPAKTELAKTAPAAAPAPAPAPVKAVATSSEPAAVREVQTPRGVVKLVDVRIDSKPSGATVMLVDNGKTSFLGTTPLATSLDPSRKYDVIFTLAGRPTQMAPLDPGKTSRLDVTLGRAKSSRSAKKEASPLGDSFIDKSGGSIAAPSARSDDGAHRTPDASLREKSAATKPEIKAEPPKAEPKQVDKADKPAKAVAEKKVAPAGEGTLMVSSKPPCEILIDGKPTGLTTPQRSIPLSAGMHKVTFVNATEGIKKTVSVSITADQSTKLIQDLMKK
jgi:hypothetical protein